MLYIYYCLRVLQYTTGPTRRSGQHTLRYDTREQSRRKQDYNNGRQRDIPQRSVPHRDQGKKGTSKLLLLLAADVRRDHSLVINTSLMLSLHVKMGVAYNSVY